MVALPLHLLTATLGGYMSYFLLSVLTLPSSPPLGTAIISEMHRTATTQSDISWT